MKMIRMEVSVRWDRAATVVYLAMLCLCIGLAQHSGTVTKDTCPEAKSLPLGLLPACDISDSCGSINGSTVLLFFAPKTPSYECVCTFDGDGQFEVFRYWGNGTILTHNNHTQKCQWTNDNDSCIKTGSANDTLTVTLPAGKQTLSIAYVLLVAKAVNSSVSVSCSGKETLADITTKQQSAAFRQPTSTTAYFDQDKLNSLPRQLISTATRVTSTTPDGISSSNRRSSSSTPENRHSNTDGLLSTESKDDNSNDKNGAFMMWIGVGLIIFSVVTVSSTLCALIIRRRMRKARPSKAPASPEDKLQMEKDSRATAILNSSRASLISDKHDYDEVLLVGLDSGICQRIRQDSEKPQPSNYSHISAGHVQLHTTTTPATHSPGHNGDDGNYNKLDLIRPTHQNSNVEKPSSVSPKLFYVGELGDDYTEYNNDIYESVSQEHTPLCGRRERPGKGELYTDCISQDGKIICSKPAQGPEHALQKLSNGHLPSLPKASSTTRLKRHSSGSVETLDRKGIRGKRLKTHKQTRSVDLHKDLIVENLMSQEQQTFHHTNGSCPKESHVAHSSNQTEKRLQNATSTPSSAEILTTPSNPSNQTTEIDQVLMRRKSRNSKKKANPEGFLSMVDHLRLKELNTGLLELETAVRHSMEIQADELIMIDNVLYGTLPRNRSLPTTEL